MIITNKDIERFNSRIEKLGPEECWNWKAGRSNGYGTIKINKVENILTHRLAYIVEYGEIPKGLLVRHKCDNRKCCNPNHLELGTIADNNRDRKERGGYKDTHIELKYVYEITKPDGTIEITNNMSEFCRQNGLRKENMHRHIKEVFSQHKGYRVRILEKL